MAKGRRYVRVFGGLKFLYKMSFTKRRQAQMFADSYKRGGYLVRTLKDRDGYHVYARKKSKPSWA